MEKKKKSGQDPHFYYILVWVARALHVLSPQINIGIFSCMTIGNQLCALVNFLYFMDSSKPEAFSQKRPSQIGKL